MCIIVIVAKSRVEGCNVLKHNVVKTKLKQSGLYPYVNQAKTGLLSNNDT